MKYLGTVDGFGVYGNYLHFGMVIWFVGSAFLIFIYLWKKGRLDMEEDAKYQMMQPDPLLQEEEVKDDE